MILHMLVGITFRKHTFAANSLLRSNFQYTCQDPILRMNFEEFTQCFFLHLLPTVQSCNILLSEQCFKNPLPPRWIWIVSSIVVKSSSSDSLRLRFKQIDDSIHAWILLLMLASAFLSLFSPSSYSSLKAKCELKFF